MEGKQKESGAATHPRGTIIDVGRRARLSDDSKRWRGRRRDPGEATFRGKYIQVVSQQMLEQCASELSHRIL